MIENVQIPIEIDWKKEEIIDVVNFYESIDKAYKKGVEREALLSLYRRFKEIVPSKSGEKQGFRDYEDQTGQSPFQVVKMARETPESKIIKM